MKKIAILVASVLVLGGFGSTRAFAAELNTQTTTQISQPAATTTTTQDTQTTTTGTQATQTTNTTAAQDTQPAIATTASYKDQAGITPDSLLYFLDKAYDNLRLLLANSDEKKAEVNAEIAEERLGESEVMTEKGKIELAQEALKAYNEAITDAASKLQAVVTNLESTTPAATSDAKPAATSDVTAEQPTDNKLEQSVSDLEKSIQNVQDKSLAVLNTLKAVTPKEDAKDVEEVIEEQKEHRDVVANFVKDRHEFNDARKALVMAKVALMKIQKSGNEADIKAAQDKLTSAQNACAEAQKQLFAAFQAKKDADHRVADKEEAKPTDATQATAQAATQAPTQQTATPAQNNQAVDQAVTAAQSNQTANQAVTANQNNQAAVQATAPAANTTTSTPASEINKLVEYFRNNNGNGNGNKSYKEEKEKKNKEKKDKEKSRENNDDQGENGDRD